MQVQVIASAGEASSADFQHRTALVIDVLRATSTIASALAAGASCVVPAETVMDAKAMAREGDILGGERFCRKIAGFELGNSPQQYSEERVAGRRVVLTTTNGTRAIYKSMRADHVIAASLLNAEACARAALALRRDVVILCAGAHDDFALEDGLCAGLLLHCLKRLGGLPVESGDFAAAMESLYADRANAVPETLHASQSGKRLLKLGLQEDIAACSRVNSLQVVPYLDGDRLVAR